MTDKEKIELADLVLNFVAKKSEGVDAPVMVGWLNHPYGFNGFKRAEIGTPVFNHKGMYGIYFENLNGDKYLEMKFGKNIEPHIDFLKTNT